MRPKSRLVDIAVAIVCLSNPFLWAQGGNSPASSQPSAPSATQGSATIENQMIAYEVLRGMAYQIAARTSKQVCNPSCEKAKRGEVLLADPTAIAEIVSTEAFNSSAAALCAAYQAPPPSPCEDLAPATARAQAFSDTTTAVAGLLTAIRSTATYSNQNFQPTPQSMVNLLSRAMNDTDIDLRTSALPGDLDRAMKDVQGTITIIAKAQRASPAGIRSDVDKEFSAVSDKLDRC